MIEMTHRSAYREKQKSALFLSGILLLLCGCLIYATWRSRDTNLCRWADAAGLEFAIDLLRSGLGMTNPGDFVKYNLPDGLYCVAYILLINYIWIDRSVMARAIISSLIPLVAVVHETLQFLKLAPGTFDPLDLLCYSLPYAIYLIILLLTHQNKTNNEVTQTS